MNQFTFESKQKTLLFAFMGLGVLCMAATLLFENDLHNIRFWTNFLHNAVFFTGISFVMLFFLAANITAWGGWFTQFKRVFEAYFAFLVPGLVLIAVIIAGLWFGWHDIYHWSDPAEVAKDPVLQGKASFLNKTWYTVGTFVIVGIWIFFAMRLRSLSVAEDQQGTPDFGHHRKMRIWAAAFLPIGGFSSAALIWQWVMSVDAHWYSTLFAWYSTASWFVAGLALTILLLIYLKSLGYFQGVTPDHFHDLGKYMFAFSIFWTYLWFSQFMLIWYGNVGEETIYFNTRMDEYPTLFYGNLLINFVLPFFVLMRNDTKRKNGTMAFAAIFVFFGHWLDYFLMIKPGALETAMHAAHTGAEHAGDHATFMAGFTIPGLLEIGTMLGFLALFLFVFFNSLAKAQLEPSNDPYLAESLHHHV
jgi:hypothetical protein